MQVQGYSRRRVRFRVHWGAARCGVVQEVVGGGGGVVSSTDHSTTGVFVV